MKTAVMKSAVTKNVITVGVDGTPHALAAATWAAHEARLRQSRLRLLTAWEPRRRPSGAGTEPRRSTGPKPWSGAAAPGSR
ncbi:universal stress protein [Streptomyces sp. NPDC020883]|uniref:universal stress protein n=1 Tax=Streptomyces sp. NPDC020883 TaxID=3365099 RepID=UPI0037B17EB3